jgi:predicted TIM-barrel fold metal-dependent hydrolase
MANNKLNGFKIFDSHFHIIDRRFPLVANDGYLPDAFTCGDYRLRTRHLNLAGGAVVSGSFHAFDQAYLRAALAELGSGFVGVTQLPATVSDQAILTLDRTGVRAVRFNLRRGGSESVDALARLAARVYDLAGWHVELYVDARALADLYSMLVALPALSIDHLGLSRQALPTVLKLVERGAKVKASGFGRVDCNIATVIRNIAAADPYALMFGTDLPSTRAPRAYVDTDLWLIVDAVDEALARDIFYNNAAAFYRVQPG